MNNMLTWVCAAAALLYVCKKDGSTFKLQPDFGVADPSTWDDAPIGTGTANGAVAGSMTDPIGTDFQNKAAVLSSAAP